MGIGTCGTCAVAITATRKSANESTGESTGQSTGKSTGEEAVSKANWKDIARRNLPPHNPEKDRRLACQTKVLDDINVDKFAGFWGHQDKVAWSTTEGKGS